MSRKQLAAILAALAAFAGALAAIVDDNGHGTSSTVTVTSANNKQVAIPRKALAAAAASDLGHHTHLGSDDASAQDLAADDRAASPFAPRVDGPPPAAAPHQAGCLTRSNTVNFSYRNGTRPALVVLHLTVSPNSAGWGDVNGVWGFLDRSATQASANYIEDSEGHCVLAIAETLKAWAQANYNSATACSIEVINTGSEATYVGPPGGPGERQLARVVHDCADRWGIPLRRAIVSGGRVVRSGVIDHYHLGAAGGGHFDIHQFGSSSCARASSSADTWPCVDHLIAAAKAVGGKPISAAARKRCTELNTLRRAARRRHLSPTERSRWGALRSTLRRHGYRCVVGPPGKHGSITRR